MNAPDALSAPTPLTRRLDIALDIAEDALNRLAEDIAAAATVPADAPVAVQTAARTVVTSRTMAAGALDRLGDLLCPDLPPSPDGGRAYDQARQIRTLGITAVEARTWALAWAAYGDAKAVAS